MRHLLKIGTAGALAFSLFASTGLQAQTFNLQQQAALELAAELYPDLFTNASAIKEAQGYIYQTFGSGVAVGFKDGLLYTQGGPFGALKSQGSVSTVVTKLEGLKSSLNLSVTSDIQTLFDLAAEAFPAFAHGSAIRVSADGYIYRYYADTGIYAAVKNGNVFLRGGSYGNFYTSTGALNAVLNKLEEITGEENPGIPEGDFTLNVTGTVAVSGFSQPFSFTIANVPAPNPADQNAIKKSFEDSVKDSASAGLTITSFSYEVVSNTSSRVEFTVQVGATITQSGFSIPYS